MVFWTYLLKRGEFFIVLLLRLRLVGCSKMSRVRFTIRVSVRISVRYRFDDRVNIGLMIGLT